MTKLHLKFKVGPGAERKLDEIGKLVVSNMRRLLRGYVGYNTKIVDNIKYRVEKNRVVIYTDNDVLTYIEEGTKPHVIIPRNKKVLAWEAGNSAFYKDGTRIQPGDMVFAKKVRHPGTDPKPFFHPGFFISKPMIEKILNSR